MRCVFASLAPTFELEARRFKKIEAALLEACASACDAKFDWRTELEMPSRRLTPEEAQKADALLKEITEKLAEVAADDSQLLFALRRRLFTRLSYAERGDPRHRKKLKDRKWKEQRGVCALCPEELPITGAELDRLDPVLGYTPENTQLVHHECPRKQQEERGFS
jgi:hypothetical protein